jgi:dienelactone hydrolase
MAGLFAVPFLLTAACQPPAPPDTHIGSLADLSVEKLRAREYGSTLQIVQNLSAPDRGPSGTTAADYTSLIASYESEGLQLFTRVDVPSSPPVANGYPVVIFVHGWIGRDGAPDYDFHYGPDSETARLIDFYARAGFLVLSPALRGHGTVNGVAADGIEFLEAWDNGSYLSPMFYTMDVLNLLDGVDTLERIEPETWGLANGIRVNTAKINIIGYSQGGDAALTALAVSGEGSKIRNRLAAGSIWSGCFGPRFEQVEIFGPMATTLEAFMSGDGSWTGTAVAPDGTVNPNYVFGYPPDWIGTVDPHSPDWTWQNETWSTPSVAEALREKFGEMYRTVNEQVAEISGADFTIESDDGGKAIVHHDPRIASAMEGIGAYGYAEFLTEPVHFHHSDQDYYSIPAWNADIVRRIRQRGGYAADFTYRQNTHALQVSNHDWFSDDEAKAGFGSMLQRDRMLFSAVSTAGPNDSNLTSIEALREYAAEVRGEFRVIRQRTALEGHTRRIVEFTADGLRQYALVVEPVGNPPERGWPVLLMNHGYHPNPPDNGRIADGSSDRPGDYYRGLPLAYARAGFLVVWPDFRGHNISQGLEFTFRGNAHHWYARDTIAAFAALESLPHADVARAFMWGHSMGGNMTLRALLALGDRVRGASIWSASSGPGDNDLPLAELRTPLAIQHAERDPSTNFNGSRSVYEQLSIHSLPVYFYRYRSDDHLFGGEEREQAIQRDILLFRSLME